VSPILQKAGQVAANREVVAAVAGRTERGAEDDLLRLEAELPELGGGYFDDHGRFVVLLTDVSRGSVAKTLARRHLSGWRMGDATRNTFAIQGDAGIVIQPAQYRFSTLVAWHSKVRAALPIPGASVSSLDADERSNRLRVGLIDVASTPVLVAKLASIGIPVDGIEVVEQGYGTAASDLRDYKRPTGAGIQISRNVNGLDYVCSLGWNVTDGLGRVGFLTAGHCLITTDMATGGMGAVFGQPAPNDPLGSVVLNSPWNYSGPGCGGQPYCTEADAIFVQYNSSSNSQRRLAKTEYYGVNYAKGSITFASGFSWYNNLFYAYVGYVGASVDKMARTTGWTRGTVAASCVDRVVSDVVTYATPCTTVVSGARVGQGDSGGPVFNSTSTTFDHVEPLGIMFGLYPKPDASWPTDGNLRFCNASIPGCSYFYASFAQIQAHLGTTFSVSNP
jgi:hypothetical protein